MPIQTGIFGSGMLIEITPFHAMQWYAGRYCLPPVLALAMLNQPANITILLLSRVALNHCMHALNETSTLSCAVVTGHSSDFVASRHVTHHCCRKIVSVCC